MRETYFLNQLQTVLKKKGFCLSHMLPMNPLGLPTLLTSFFLFLLESLRIFLNLFSCIMLYCCQYFTISVSDILNHTLFLISPCIKCTHQSSTTVISLYIEAIHISSWVYRAIYMDHLSCSPVFIPWFLLGPIYHGCSISN